MISDPSYYSSFKARSLAEQHLTLEEKYVILEALYKHARLLGGFGESDLQLGLQAAVRLAASLNRNVSSTPR
jgi:hypothetical protein